MFKVMTSSTPAYLSDLIQTTVPARPLRSSDAPLLTVPRVRTELARRALSVAAPQTWNSLPADIRSCVTLQTFKSHLKTYLFFSFLTGSTSTSASRVGNYGAIQMLYYYYYYYEWINLVFGILVSVRYILTTLCFKEILVYRIIREVEKKFILPQHVYSHQVLSAVK